MDALIRSARLAPFRTRLSEAPVRGRTAPGADATSGAKRDEQQSVQDALRAEIEARVRSELASHVQELYEDTHASAHADGYAAGMAEAKAAAAKELAQAREQLEASVEAALSALGQAHQAALSKLESSVGEVAFAAVCRLMSGLASSQTFVLSLVKQTCAQMRADAVATARLHPRDIQILGELVQDDGLRIQSLGLKVIPDESLELGGCVIEASSGQYDGGLEGQLRRLHAALVAKG